MQIDEFLEEVYALARTNQIPAATDRIFDHIDHLLCDGAFGICNEILSHVQPERLPSSLRRSFLTITAVAKQKIPARTVFYQKALHLLAQEKGEEQARTMLSRLA